MPAFGLAHCSPCTSMLYVGLHRLAQGPLEVKLGAKAEGFLGEACPPEEIEEALAIAGYFPLSQRLVASSLMARGVQGCTITWRSGG
jgi:hypothetical protein